ncbi:MAG: hypothetical protein U1E73_05330 [Planctomycetota bacterium]
MATRTTNPHTKNGGTSKSDRIRELLKTDMSAGEIAKQVGATTALVYTLRSRGGGTKRGPGRPRKAATATNVDGLAAVLDAVKNGERERAQLRAALEKIQAVLANALS